MAIKTAKQGTIISRYGQTANCIYIITNGSVRSTYYTEELLLEKGDILGLLDLNYDFISSTSIAETDVTLFEYPCVNYIDLLNLLKTNTEIAGLLATSLTKHVCQILDNFILLQYSTDNFYHFLINSYDEYKRLCTQYHVSAKALPGMEALEKLILEDDIEPWLSDYYESVRDLNPETQRKLFFDNPNFLIGYILRAGLDVHKIMEIVQLLQDYQGDISYLLLNENHLDFFDLYSSLYFRAIKENKDTMFIASTISKMMIQIEAQPNIEKSLYKNRANEYKTKLLSLESDGTRENDLLNTTPVQNSNLTDSLTMILEYSACLDETAASFRKHIHAYKQILDKTSDEENLRTLRKTLTTLFYEIYTSAFQVSLSDKNIPTILKMFFLFGYVDEDLAGFENASYLYSISEQYSSDYKHGVFSIYDWLRLIYSGEKEPSRNEFDIDYTQYVRESKLNGKLTDETEKRMLSDQAQKVMFELKNMFPLVNKITYGRISSFCPIFSEHNLLKSPDSILVSPDLVKKALTTIRSLDYSAFYRETIYTNPQLDIKKEMIQVEILPDIILMPNIGTRGVMWQEIEGRKRTTPARMMLSIMCLDDVLQLVIRLTGEYRWELCKRIQGSRWNDVTDPSLTSEYFDYIQFYRKNNELSQEAKEKIKLSLQKAKNNFKEMFVRDYISWITYESNSSPRLNKQSRKILFSYCAFSKSTRKQLKTNPLYKEMSDRYDLKIAQKLHHINNVYQKIRNSGNSIPPELIKQNEFLDR